ncbi:type III pantothenate kinase [Polaribacter glomeratus]|uniref:Type III pantothenate kinase n=1 Tax=Polaribacter glomeratus TaxID=102 RepID=A0A2S7WIQ0_9FLAO|nr:type III pantothenate kinase [Polaribacter glomeratus]PQJ77485.1 pantothenate kinase [Polaribacter glomeratus]TXD66077.1 type III pantothenate kinase [Polaribacter glomeratus]
MNLIIDAGNTRVKVAVFERSRLVEVVIIDKKRFLSEIKKIVKKHEIFTTILSSVSFISEKKLEKLKNTLNLVILSSSTNVPFTNLYETPKTLGVDRIALVSAAVKKFPNKNILIIDAGTCITFDFVNDKSAYFGGAISPGVEMRYKALHTFTSKLPIVEKNYPKNFIGNNTIESINSGVVNGVVQEIEGVINQYKNKFSDLTVVLTGGDTNFLAKQLKSSIFAHQNFLLEGLNEILIFNKNK